MEKKPVCASVCLRRFEVRSYEGPAAETEGVRDAALLVQDFVAVFCEFCAKRNRWAA
jgi:hypothetical protein